MGERVRIQDIAEELGLSTATVSNVIHGKTKRVSKETVKRVQALLERRQYIPSMAGVLLAQNNSRIIGVVINDHPKSEGRVLEDAFIASAVNALSAEIERAGYFMMVKPTAAWNEIIRYASMWNMEGLILLGFCQSDYRELRDNIRIPLVVYDGFFPESPRTCNLVADNYDGGYQAGRYLRRMGHRRVLCLADNEVCMDKDRMDGCRAGMGGGTDFWEIPMVKTDRARFYEAHLAELLSYTAVFAASDVYAVELMLFLQRKGVAIPGDISVVGFDNIPLCDSVYPGLTTVGQDTGERARRALAALEALKAGPMDQPLQVLPVRLVERESVRRIDSDA